MTRRLALALLAVAAPLVAASGQGTPRWDVRSSAAVDLWYHGLALVGHEGPGPLPWYSADHVRAVRADREQRNVHTRLDRERAELGRAFRRDSTFESLHFLPLYFTGEWPERLLDIVRSVSGGDMGAGQGVTASPDPADAALAAALRRVFVTGAQRQTLRRFADALDDEWRHYLRDARARDAARTEARLRAVRARWESDVEPAVRERGGRPVAGRGTIVVSAALGAEGRLIRFGDAAVVAVQMPPDDEAGLASALSVARELCFPLARQDVSLSAPPTDRHAASDASSRAAASCGARLFAHRPDLAGAYQALFHAALISRREP